MSPLQKEYPPPPPSAANPPPKNDTSLRAIRRLLHDHPKIGAELTHRTPSTLTPSFLQAVRVQKCTEIQHKEVIQTSSAEGSAAATPGRVVFVTFHPFERKTSLPAILHLFFVCCCQHRRQSCHLLTYCDPVDYLNSNVGWLVVTVYGCGFFFLSCGSDATHTKDVFGRGQIVFRMSTSRALFEIDLTHLIKSNEPCLPALAWRRC